MKTLFRSFILLFLLCLSTPAAAQNYVRLWPNGAEGTIDANDEAITISNAREMGTMGLQITGTYSGTVAAQCSIDGTNWVAVRITPINTTSAVTSITDSTGIWTGSIAGCKSVRLVSTAWTSGTATVEINTIQGGGGSGSGGGAAGAVQINDGTDTALVSAGGELLVSCADCSGSGVAHVDDAAFTPATDDVVPIAGVLDNTAPDSVNEGDAGAVRMSANRNLFITVRDAAGNERGLNVDANGAIAAVVSGADIDVQSGGADILSTTAFNAAFGVAGTADSQVISIQGIASMTPVTVNGTVTANLSATDNAVLDDIADGIPVTNAGTFAVQSVEGAGALLTSSQLIDNIVSVEDAVAGSAFSGVAALAVRQDSHSDLAADGDFIPLTVDADGGLRVSIVAGAGSGGTALADDADFTAGTTSFTPSGGFYQSTVTACTDGDTCAFGITAQRTLKATLFTSAGVELTSTDVAEDAASAGGELGPMVLAIRDDTLDARSGAEGDFEPLHTNASGALWVAGNGSFTVTDGSGALNVICDSGCSGGTQYAEDAVHASGNTGTLALVVRNDAGTALAADGDNIPLMVNSAGSLFTTVTGSVTITDGAGAVNVICDSGCSGGTQFAEDAASQNGDVGTIALAIRDDTLDARSTTEGDFEYLHTNANGALWVKDVDIPTIFGTDAIFGTAGTADTDVLTVQGIASMTPLLVNPGTAANFGIYVEDAAETAGGNLMMAGAVVRTTAAGSSATGGDNATFNVDGSGLLWTRQLDPCSGVAKTYIPINISSATTTELTAALAGASNHYYICALSLITDAANDVALTDDDTDNCASVTAGIAGGTTAASGWNFGAAGGLTIGSGNGSIMRTNGTNRVLCMVTSAATQLSGHIVVAAAP
jgi:hypothetical protein